MELLVEDWTGPAPAATACRLTKSAKSDSRDSEGVSVERNVSRRAANSCLSQAPETKWRTSSAATAQTLAAIVLAARSTCATSTTARRPADG